MRLLVQGVPLAPVANPGFIKETTLQQMAPIAKNVRLDFTLHIKMKMHASHAPPATTVRIFPNHDMIPRKTTMLAMLALVGIMVMGQKEQHYNRVVYFARVGDFRHKAAYLLTKTKRDATRVPLVDIQVN